MPVIVVRSTTIDPRNMQCVQYCNESDDVPKSVLGSLAADGWDLARDLSSLSERCECLRLALPDAFSIYLATKGVKWITAQLVVWMLHVKTNRCNL